MSLNELNLNLQKPWLNARVQDLTVDGETSVGDISAGVIEAEGLKFPDPSTLLNYYRFQPSAALIVSGSFVISPISITARVAQIGTLITVDLPEFEIQIANQNASGTIEINTELIVGYTGTIPMFVADGSHKLCLGQFTTGHLRIDNGLNSATWTSGTLIQSRAISFSLIQ